MSCKEKSFIYYYRIRVKEGLNIELKTSQLMLGNYNKEIQQSCKYCHQVIEIKKDFNENPFSCNICFKLLKNEDKINPQMHIIWSENQQHTVFTNLHRSYLDRIFRFEDIKEKFENISKETINKHLNAYFGSLN